VGDSNAAKRHDDAAGSAALDRALGAWPTPRKTEQEWEHFAHRIDARVALTKRPKSLQYVSDEELLGTPLPEDKKGSISLPGDAQRHAAPPEAPVLNGPGAEVAGIAEGSMGQSTFERERDRRGFRELAKLAGPEPRAKANTISGIRRTTSLGAAGSTENDSGMVDLEVLSSQDPGAVDRASVTPLASAALFEDEAPRALPSAPSSRPAVPPPPSSRSAVKPGPIASPTALRPMTSAPATLPAGIAPVPLVAVVGPARSKRSPVGAIGAVIGLASIAAGAFFVVRSSAPPSASTASVAGPAHVTAEPASAVVAKAPPVQPAPDPGVDPMSLPKQGQGQIASNHAAAAHSWHSAHAGAQVIAAKPEPKETPDAPVAVAKADSDSTSKAAPAPAAKAPEAAPAAAVPANNALLAAIMSSAPAKAPVGANAAPTPGAPTAQRPSQGQITGALSAVLPGARACLGDDDEPSRAHVVFGSDGAVQSVAITGFAVGKPSEACIKTALTKAHVPPFAEATYGATVTVRP
jgi:hypothetical protein